VVFPKKDSCGLKIPDIFITLSGNKTTS